MDIMNHNILVWNIRGLNNPARGAVVRDIVQEASASIVCLVESKLQAVDQRTISGLLGLCFNTFVALPAHGTVGGIVVAWDSSVVSVPAFRVDFFSVTIEMVFVGGLQWTLTTVYGPMDDQLKTNFLDEPRNIRAACLGPWAVAGDFNLIVDAADKNNDMLNRRMMGRFRRLLNDLELKESSLIGRRYTWSNERQSLTLEKIDRWFSTADWDAGHPDHLLQALSSSISDHCPILMSTNVSFHRKSRFHFQSFWPSIPGFQEAVATGWNTPPPKSDPFFDLFLRLKATANALTKWSQRRVGNVKEQILLANEVIFQLDKAMDSRTLSEAESWLRRELKKKALGLASLQRIIARQKSRISWISEGEANTQFFQSFASHRRRRNHIFCLRNGDDEATSRDDMCAMAGEYFAGILGKPSTHAHSICLDSLHLPPVDASALESPLFEEIIWNTIKSMQPDKAPGPVMLANHQDGVHESCPCL